MHFLEICRIGLKNDEGDIIKDICFNQKKWEKVVISGSTGSGKTALLKMIAGLIKPSEGTILFEGKSVKGPQDSLLPAHPAIAYLSQHFELRNHYRVEEILSIDNRLTDVEALAIYELCRIHHLLKRWTHQLSGGEKQRIALARLLVSLPKLLLLDEPFSNLDAIHKNILKSVIDDVSKHLNTTLILVSHDPLDTLSWGDRILVLKNGSLVQQGTPEEIYYHPAEEYTAALFGKYTVLNTTLKTAFNPLVGADTTLNKFVRPEEFKLVNGGNSVYGEVKKVVFMGGYFEIEVLLLDNSIILNTTQKVETGDMVYVSLIQQ
ncbi:MAG: ABC transporter ATP-binding protein [Bacteroidota bacterium]|nr:ABC transporter ATP-binding protein [Bacteroidota bacterium]